MIQTTIFYELCILFENWEQNIKILCFYIRLIQPCTKIETRILNEQKSMLCKSHSVKYTLSFTPSLDHSKIHTSYYLEKLPYAGTFLYLLPNLNKIERKKQAIEFTKKLKCPNEPFAKTIFGNKIDIIRTLKKLPIILLKCYGMPNLVVLHDNFIKSLNRLENEIRECECDCY